MPELNGYEVCSRLKASCQTKDIPIIFISALNEVFDKVKAFEVGGVDYITKHFQAQEVLARVEHQLHIQRLSQQLVEQNAQLETANRALKDEIQERQQVEELLRSTLESLEVNVQERTAELTKINESLQAEIGQRKRVESMLQLTQFSVQQASDSIFWVDSDAKILGVNKAACHLLGYSEEELLSLSVHDIEPDYHADIWLTHWQELKEHGSLTFESRHKRKDGTIRPTEVNANFLEFEGKEYNFAFARDITERKLTQRKLIHTEKMSSLGQLIASVAHEINNPVNFIGANLSHVDNYTRDLLALISLYQEGYAHSSPEIQDKIEEIDLDFLIEDLPKTLSSMKMGAERIGEIVLTLRSFSRLDEAQMKSVNIHEGIDSTLLILRDRLKEKPEHSAISIIKEYGNLPLVESLSR